MSELRKDPFTTRWSIIATERQKRPHDFRRAPHTRSGGNCPFCWGNEHLTPPEVLAYRESRAGRNTPGWSVRVFPNKFPALDPGLPRAEKTDGPLVSMAGSGYHEVLVETPEHHASIPTYSTEQLSLALQAMGERLQALKQTGSIAYVQVFKNEGAVAGASLEHPHFQIVGLPLVPAAIAEELEVARAYHQSTGGCLHCAVLEHERLRRARVVEESPGFVCHCPFASRFPYEMSIHPQRHSPDFLDTDRDELEELAGALIRAVGRLEGAFPEPDYNMVLHTAPFGEAHPYYHWHLEILPRLTVTAGFEWGTGLFINPTAPETASEELRAVTGPWAAVPGPDTPGSTRAIPEGRRNHSS
ncbi:MAG: DUF4931 domain-containing protein [Bacillota bacterium]